MRLLFITALLLGTTLDSAFGRVSRKSNSPPLRRNNGHIEQMESLCVRMHNNTAFLGAQPYSKLLVKTASECQKTCMDQYPKCSAVVFYYIYREHKDHLCFLFSQNSVNDKVTLVPEKPRNSMDQVRALEIAVDCHEFDPFPPLPDPFVMSSDIVTRDKREAGFLRPVRTIGSWSGWAPCSYSGKQTRSQRCEYGRSIQRRSCESQMLGASEVPQTTHDSLYPPTPYIHPPTDSAEYLHRMKEHEQQMGTACCNKQEQAQLMQVHPADPFPTPCPVACPRMKTAALAVSPPRFVAVPTQPSYPRLETGDHRYPAIAEYEPVEGRGQLMPTRPSYGRPDGLNERFPGPLKNGFNQGRPDHKPTMPRPDKPGHQFTGIAEHGGNGGRTEYGQTKPQARPNGQYKVLPGYGEYSVGGGQPSYGRADEMDNRFPMPGERRPDYQKVEAQPRLDDGLTFPGMAEGRPEYEQIIPHARQQEGRGFPGSVEGRTDYARIGPQGPLDGSDQRQPGYADHGAGGARGDLDRGAFEYFVEPKRPAIVAPPPAPEWSQWSSWSPCSASCGSGQQERSRACEGGGQCFGEGVERRHCEAPQPCRTWSDWCEWSPCKATCGMGERSRTRYCELGNMRCEGPDFEAERCDAGPCPEWTPWEQWTPCTASCGGGIMRRHRYCPDGLCAGSGVEERQCGMTRCPAWTQWSHFSQCSVSCGPNGVITRFRECHGGPVCPGNGVEELPCPDSPPCPHWTEWDDWSQCSVSCGHGILTRQRQCIGGICEGPRVEQVPCDLAPCSYWAQWQPWSQCSASCGEGLMHRTRNCQYGNDCEGLDKESQACIGPPCPSWTEWTDWSGCSADCGPGEKTRTRLCLAGGAPSEACSGPSKDSVPCNEGPCCHWSNWREWSLCDRSCGGGRMTRERVCESDSIDGGIGECHCPGPQREFHECNTHPCIPVCSWTPWCPWSECSATEPCTIGKINRRRQCVGDAGCNCYGFADETHSCRTECHRPRPPVLPQEPCPDSPTDSPTSSSCQK